MKQPRTTETISIINSSGEVESVSRSIATEGWPTGPPGDGKIQRCPVTGDVMWREQMVLYKGRYYSPEGAEEERINDSLRDS